jgi:hypothetical protein
LVFGVEIAEALEVQAGRRGGFGPLARHCAIFEAIEPLGDVAVPGAFRVLAVVDNGEASSGLPADHVGNRAGEVALVSRFVDRFALEALAHVVH